jgi:hypothetical protein
VPFEIYKYANFDSWLSCKLCTCANLIDVSLLLLCTQLVVDHLSSVILAVNLFLAMVWKISCVLLLFFISS